MTQSRQLAAIMFTDIVGYTALMGKDEQKAFELLKKNRAVQRPLIEKFNGRWLKEIGDGVLASFSTVTDAVYCAKEIQETCQMESDLNLRIGIHQGEVVFEGDDVFGDGVNIASRIESLAVGPCVLISKAVRDQIKNNADFQISSLGNYEFKNVEDPMEIFVLSNPGTEASKLELNEFRRKPKRSNRRRVAIISVAVIATLITIFLTKNIFLNAENSTTPKSLAILPFDNLQGDSSLLYLSNGIPENLINRLSSFEDIRVFARSATFNLADSLRSISSLKRLLDTDLILSGQLVKTQGASYINCQLVDASNQNQIWGRKFEMSDNDISLIEDSIVRALMNPLKIVSDVSADDQNKKVAPEAYEHYLKGRYLSYGSTPEESDNALAHFREAIQIEPAYAKAYAAISNEKVIQSLFSTASKNEIVNEARLAIEAAKALDPDLAEIYTSEGALKFYIDWNWQGAVDSYNKALTLDPGNATIYIRYSATLAAVGRYEQALKLADKAVSLDPISISSLHNLGWVNLLANNFEQSADAFGKALELHPNWVWGYIKQAYAYIFLQEYDKALQNAEKAQLLFKDGWGSELLQITLIFIYTKCNQPEKANDVTKRFLKYVSEGSLEDPWDLSYLYYLRGDYQKAIEWEQKVIDEKSLMAYHLNLPLFYDKLFFESPEHQQILKQLVYTN